MAENSNMDQGRYSFKRIISGSCRIFLFFIILASELVLITDDGNNALTIHRFAGLAILSLQTSFPHRRVLSSYRLLGTFHLFYNAYYTFPISAAFLSCFIFGFAYVWRIFLLQMNKLLKS